MPEHIYIIFNMDNIQEHLQLLSGMDELLTGNSEEVSVKFFELLPT